MRDITDRKRGERLATLRQRLLELIPLGDLDQLLRAALDVAEDLTHSQIGFLHFFTENQEEISLQVWSSRTLAAEMCRAAVKDRHYPVREAGVWVDCIRHGLEPERATPADATMALRVAVAARASIEAGGLTAVPV